MTNWTCWSDAYQYFSRVTDRLGKPIDKGIQDTVVVLNLLGLETTGSCEGHIGWGLPYPWITVAEEQKFHLHQLLERFYQEHHPPFGSTLVFQAYRIQSRGGLFWESYSEEHHAQYLPIYREEMEQFTRFLHCQLPEELKKPSFLQERGKRAKVTICRSQNVESLLD